MIRSINVVLGLQVTLTVLVTMTALATGTSGGLAIVGMYFYYLPMALLLAMFGLWAMWQYPEQRAKAAAIAALPLVALFAPSVILNTLGGPVSDAQFGGLFLIAAIAAVGFCLVAPRKAIAIMPAGLFRSRVWNGLIVAALSFAWLVFLVILLLTIDDFSSNRHRGDQGTALSYVLIFASIYLLCVGAASVLTTVWAWMGLRGGVEGACRKLNIAQLALSVPGVLIGVAALLSLTHAR